MDLPARENLEALRNRFPSIEIVPISAMKGEGIEELKATLAERLSDTGEEDRQSENRDLHLTRPVES
jgi:selenocysteine-specific translation elongation factor